MTKLKNSKCDRTWKLKFWQNSNTFVTKSKIKLWQNSKTQIGTNLKNLNCDQTQKLKLWPNSKSQIVTIPKLLQFFVNCFLVKPVCDIFQQKKMTHWQPRDVFRAVFLRYSQYFFSYLELPNKANSLIVCQNTCVFIYSRKWKVTNPQADVANLKG